MVNPKRVERKIPLLITDAPWYSTELDRNEYRVKQFKKHQPQKFNLYLTTILSDLEKLQRAVNSDFKRNRTR